MWCGVAVWIVTLTPNATLRSQGPAGQPAREVRVQQTPVQVAFTYRPDPSSSFRPLADGSILRSGQEIKLELQARMPVHAYVLHRGSSGKWLLLFPNRRITSDTTSANPLEPNKPYTVPGKDSALFLDDTEGVEEFLVYATPEPDATLEAVAARIRDGEQLAINIVDDVSREPARPPAKPMPSTDRTRPRQGVVTGEVNVSFRDIIVVPIKTSATFDLPAGRSIARVTFQHRR